MRQIASVIPSVLRCLSGAAAKVARRFPSLDTAVALRRALSHPLQISLRWAVILVAFSLLIAAQYCLGVYISRFGTSSLWLWQLIAAIVVISTMFITAARPTHAFVGWIVVSPIIYYFYTGDFFGEGVPPISFDRLAVPLLVVALLARTLVNRRSPRRLSAPELLLVSFVLFSGVNLVLIQKQTNTRIVGTYIDEVVFCAVIYFIAKAALRTERHLVWAICALVVVGFITSFAVVVESHTGYKWWGFLLGLRIRLDWMDVGVGRGSGLWRIPHTSQIFCSMTALLALHLARSSRRALSKALYVISMASMILAVYFAYSRTGYIAFGLMLVMVPVFTRGSRTLYAALAVAVFAVVAGMTPWLLQNKQFERRMLQDTTTARININQTNINLIKHRLAFGVGHGQVLSAFEQYVANLAHRNEKTGRGAYAGLRQLNAPHNFHLKLLGEEGLVGGLLYYSAITLFLRQMLLLRKRLSSDGPLGTSLPSILLSATLANLLVLNFYSGPNVPYPAYVFWIVFAVMTRLSEIVADRCPEAVVAPVSNIPTGKSSAIRLGVEVGG